MAANIFDGSTDSNWGTAANWSLGTVPTASDGHVATFDATSPNCTVNSSARVCNAIDFTGYTNTITMSVILTVSGNVTLDSGMTISSTGGLVVNAAATLTSNGKTWPNILTLSTTVGFNQAISGTTLFSMRTSGTWSGGGLVNNLEINATGAITISGTVSASNLTYVTATSVTTTGSTLSCSNANATWDTAGIIWNNVTLGAGVITLNSLFTATGTMTVASANTVTFAGTNGFNVANYVCATAGRTTTFVEAVTYTITTSLTLTATAASKQTFTSAHASTKAILTLTDGCNIDVGFVNATRIDSSLGRTIWTFHGTITNSDNWSLLVAPITKTS